MIYDHLEIFPVDVNLFLAAPIFRLSFKIHSSNQSRPESNWKSLHCEVRVQTTSHCGVAPSSRTRTTDVPQFSATITLRFCGGGPVLTETRNIVCMFITVNRRAASVPLPPPAIESSPVACCSTGHSTRDFYPYGLSARKSPASAAS